MGVGRIVLDAVDSTNAEAARVARFLTEPTWIMAHIQTAARGRRGRAWEMPPGNFAATLLMRPDGLPAVVALRSFVAALALYDACVALCGRPDRFALKWPNDLLLNGGKLAGILLESAGRPGGVSHLAVGIGVNLAAVPDLGALEPGAVPPVSLQAETGVAVTPEDFLAALAPAFARWEAILATEGFAPIRAAWLARAARLGERLIARTGTATYDGRFEGIDDRGALVLVTADGRKVIAAADVFFG